MIGVFPSYFAKYANTTLNLIVLGLSFVCLVGWRKLTAKDILIKHKASLSMTIISMVVLCLILGNRSINGGFGDTYLYAHHFNLLRSVAEPDVFIGGEWVFNWLMYQCSRFGDVDLFFTVVCFGYVFFAFWGIYRIFRNETYGAWLFYIGAFSFFSYATNGIRNGLASALIICALSYTIIPKQRNWLIAILLAFLSIGIHKSAVLPIVCLAMSFCVKNIKVSTFFWVFAIIIYLTASGLISDFFTGMGFDDRLTGYIENSEQYASRGFTTGFRLDFLLYSVMPIWLGWYINTKHPNGIDRTYQLLLNTYIFANAFWVMLMGAAYSNRFAYLSWFLYPLVLAYPCLRLNIWGQNQGKNAGLILLAHTGFTVFMQFIYYGALF